MNRYFFTLILSLCCTASIFCETTEASAPAKENQEVAGEQASKNENIVHITEQDAKLLF